MSEVIVGWGGRDARSIAAVRHPRNEDDVARELATGEGMIARGLGRSYGDAAQLSGGVVLTNRGLSHIGPIVDGVVTVDAGTSIDELLSSTRAPGLVRPRHARHPPGHDRRGGGGGHARKEPPPRRFVRATTYEPCAS